MDFTTMSPLRHTKPVVAKTLILCNLKISQLRIPQDEVSEPCPHRRNRIVLTFCLQALIF